MPENIKKQEVNRNIAAELDKKDLAEVKMKFEE